MNPGEKRPLETPAVEKKEIVTIKDSWFDEYLVANMTAPQVLFAITSFLTLAVLRDPPEDWATFYSSRLSPDQFAKLKEKMERVHESEGIEMTVSENRIYGLWKDGRDGVKGTISTIVPKLGRYREDPGIIEINAFFKDPENKATIRKIIEFLSAVKKAFYAPEPREWLLLYKKRIKQRPATVAEEERPAYFFNLIKNELEKQKVDMEDLAVKATLEALRVNMNPPRNYHVE